VSLEGKPDKGSLETSPPQGQALNASLECEPAVRQAVSECKSWYHLCIVALSPLPQAGRTTNQKRCSGIDSNQIPEERCWNNDFEAFVQDSCTVCCANPELCTPHCRSQSARRADSAECAHYSAHSAQHGVLSARAPCTSLPGKPYTQVPKMANLMQAKRGFSLKRKPSRQALKAR
jgi:hypothetical protein